MFVYISGQKVSYLKRVAHGQPAISFAKSGEYVRPYTERQAKGWVNTLTRYGFDAVARTD